LIYAFTVYYIISISIVKCYCDRVICVEYKAL